MVVRRGINETSIVPMARWARDDGLILRFIEYMDVGHTNGWRLDDVVPAAEIVDDDRRRDAARAAAPAQYRGEVANRWRYRDGVGEVGVIASVTPAVLRRLHARPALGRGQALHLPLLGRRPRPASGRSAAARRDDELREAIAGVWRVRDDRYSELRTAATADLPRVEMFAMGG